MRLADLLAGLSRAADLGFGLQAGESLRSCALAVRLARSLDLPDGDVQAAFYTALLHHVGCTGYAHETARIFGDELVLNVAAGRTDVADARDTFVTFLPELTRGRRPLERAVLAFTAVTRGSRFGDAYTTAACEVGRAAARRLGLPEAVQHSLFHVYELWQGGGIPGGLAGEEIPVGSRVARLTGIAVLFDTIGGTELAVNAVRRRGGGMLDPRLAEHFVERAAGLLDELNAVDVRAAVLDAEPAPAVCVEPTRLVDVATVFADLTDLKSPYTHGHSRGVAALARTAAERLRLPAPDIVDVEVAGLLHDLGRVAVSNTVWEKPGALTAADWEQVRLHAYHSERILAGSEQLAPLAPLVGMHHERLDGTGYHRGCAGSSLPTTVRLLAAADAYQAMTQDRPHRRAFAPEQAGRVLRTAARDGSLDADAVEAVLAAAGHPVSTARRQLPAALTEREVQVLVLVAQGYSNAQIAERLVISRRTAEHHVQHIYRKIGVASRAAVAMFAMEHDLLRNR
jgi:HD-GYP domain-containing protein (c-di-GMP phosphodiesterase class II)